MTTFIMVNILPALSLTTLVFIYMYIRMVGMLKEIDDKTYAPRPTRSAVELLVFILLYALSLVVLSNNTLNTGAMLGCTLISFMLAYLLMNMLMVRYLKLFSVVLAIIVFGGYYYLVAEAAKLI